jgi:hypothetical protein
VILCTKLAAAVLGGMVLMAAYAPAFAGSDAAGATQTATATSDHSIVGVLGPMLADAAPHQAQKACKAETLYSQHSVVGDPDACFVNRTDVRAASTAPGGVVGMP